MNWFKKAYGYFFPPKTAIEVPRVIQKTLPKPSSVAKKKKREKCYLTDKVCRTEKDAKNAAQNYRPKLRAYKCQFCDWWHLTHKKNKLTFH